MSRDLPRFPSWALNVPGRTLNVVRRPMNFAEIAAALPQTAVCRATGPDKHRAGSSQQRCHLSLYLHGFR